MPRKLFLFVPFLLLVHVTSTVALPECPGIYDPNTWHDCVGIYEHEDVFHYLGEFKHGKYHGRGTGSRMTGDKYFGEWKSHKWLSGRKYTKEEVPSDIMALFKKD